MLRYVDTSITPPGGAYPYKQPETGQVLTALNLASLVQKAKAHCVANNIPVGIDFDRQVEDNSCRELLEKYPDYAGCEEESGAPIKTSWSLSDVFRWTETMVAWARKGFNFVDQAKANERAEICARCPKNIDISGCFSCNGISKFMPLIKGNRTTPYDEKLRFCGTCGCVLKAMVHFPTETLDKTHPDDLPYDPNCWIKAEKAGLGK